MHAIEFTVQGEGKFPFAMLSFDQCFPICTASANLLCSEGNRTVKLIRLAPLKGFNPSYSKWGALGWKCTLVNKRRL